MMTGNVSQWGEVKKKTDRSRSKAKDTQAAPAESSTPAVRGGRGRGGFEGRGRARGDRGRGRGGGRGAAAHTNGTRTEKTSTQAGEWGGAAAAPEPGAWETSASKPSDEWGAPANGDTTAEGWGTTDGTNNETTKEEPKSSLIPEGSKKGWASLFAKPAPPPPQKKVPIPTAPPAEPPAEPAPTEKLAEPVAAPVETPAEEQVAQAPETPQKPASQPSVHVSPSNDELNETNLGQVPDVSVHPSTATAASTQDPNSVLGGATPQTRPVSGYAASAYKATGAGRQPNFQRRVMEQQEAVVMPGNHAVDRAAVQFGSMGLNGSIEDTGIDEEREEAETRAQPPQHSPVAPRASLPPSTQAQPPLDATPAARPAPGLPPAPAVSAADASLNDFGRYGDAQKAYDPFSQQVSQPQPQIQEPFSNQAPIHTQPAATTGSDYSPFYAADQQRNPYNYYGAYSQAQEAAALQQRIGSGFGVSGADVQPQMATSQPPGRYGHVEAPNSGHNTPNPTLPGQTQQQQVQQSQQHMPHGQQQQGAHGAGYGYGYPYYSSPHYAASYMNQIGQQHQYGRNRPMYDDARRYDEQQYIPHNNQFGYGGQYGPYGKGAMYGQPQHGYSYEHSSSPANVGGFNQAVPGREAAYGRTGSAQPSESQQSTTASAFAGMAPDVFARGQSGLGFGQNQHMGQQQPVSSEEAVKGFETSKAGGPSPSLAQPNRPGSATNSIPGQPQAGQTGLPPMQGQQPGQQAFGAYPHLTPQQYGGLGGLGGHQVAATQSHHQGSGYGNYGGAGFVNNYHGNTGRGGWGGNYGH